MAGNRTTVVIKAKIKAIKWRGKVKEGGFEKREEKRSIKKKN